MQLIDVQVLFLPTKDLYIFFSSMLILIIISNLVGIVCCASLIGALALGVVKLPICYFIASNPKNHAPSKSAYVKKFCYPSYSNILKVRCYCSNILRVRCPNLLFYSLKPKKPCDCSVVISLRSVEVVAHC